MQHRRRGGLATLVTMGLLVSACTGVAPDATPVQPLETECLPIASVQELAAMSTVVMIGELTEIRSNVFVLRPDSEDPQAFETVYDGWVFRPIGQVKGDSGNEVVVGLPSGIREAVTGTLVSVFSLDAYRIDRSDMGHRYVMFLTETDRPHLWELVAGPLAVAEVNPDGTLEVGRAYDVAGGNPLEPFRGRDVSELVNVLNGALP
jgi:hypothetical protein